MTTQLIILHAIAVEGGKKSRLAQALGVAPSTVSTWLARGLPQSVAYELVRLYGRRRIPNDPRKWAPPKEKTA
jgi:hypothetical protein